MQNVVKLAPLIKPCIILGVTLFLVYDGKSSEYFLILRVLFPLLQMVQFIMAIARTTSVPPWMRSEAWAGISYLSLSYAFVEV